MQSAPGPFTLGGLKGGPCSSSTEALECVGHKTHRPMGCVTGLVSCPKDGQEYYMIRFACQSRFDARYWMLGAGALGRPRGML